MKKILIIATAIILSGSTYFLSGKKLYAGQPVNKDINVEVYKTSSYISPAYANAFATLEVTVIRVQGNKRDTAFQHTFQPKELKDFPASDKPFVQTINIPNVNDNKEKLEIHYKVTYDSKRKHIEFPEYNYNW